ncbi:MAG TPA: helix-turn-helix transcriptional regulator [Sphingomicrobium sp.]
MAAGVRPAYGRAVMKAAPELRSHRPGRETLGPGVSIPRHRHRGGYVAVVLSGGYQEAGLAGRFDVSAGDVVVHREFDAHLDHVRDRGAEILNLPLPPGTKLPSAFRIADPDAIVRLAERDTVAAAMSLVPMSGVVPANDWPDELASDLNRDSGHRLRCWAHARNLAPETLSRRFRMAYGLTPAAFRAEARAQRAFTLVCESDASLASIAADCGFADQPHLTRAIVRLTGHPPGFWRGSIPFKTRGHRTA